MATIREALTLVANYHRKGRLREAEQMCRKILQVHPAHAGTLHRLGMLAGQQGQYQAAIEYLARAVALDGRQAAAHNDLGAAYAAAGDLSAAQACFEHAVQLAPDFAAAHSNLGLLAAKQGRFAEALACYRRVLEQEPDCAAVHHDLGVVLQEQGKLDEAAVCYCRALQLQPDHVEAHSNLGVLWQEQGKLDEARESLRRALALQPDHVAAHYNLGCVWQEQGNLDEAAACYHRVLELQPDHAEALNNLGVVWQEQGDLDQANACYRRALELHPNYAHKHCNQAILHLLQGDFQRGWPEYQWRWQLVKRHPGRFSQSLWDGRPLGGQSILLHSEQGLGDSIQFVRYAALLKQQGARVVVECQRPLVALLQRCTGVDRVVARGDALPECDCHSPLLGLPGLFQTELHNIPANVPYLTADPALVAQWRERLRGLPGFQVGIAWQGSPGHRLDRARSIPLPHFAPLAEVPGVRLISLQKGPGVEQLPAAAACFPIVELGPFDEQAGAFMDTAAMMMSLDLVVTSDTSVAHLAGALGVPVWTALPLVPDWRWLLDRDDSPWYPSMRLFRQTARGDWDGVFQRIRQALFAAGRTSRVPGTDGPR